MVRAAAAVLDFLPLELLVDQLRLDHVHVHPVADAALVAHAPGENVARGVHAQRVVVPARDLRHVRFDLRNWRWADYRDVVYPVGEEF